MNKELSKTGIDYFAQLYDRKLGLYVGNGVRCYQPGAFEYENLPELDNVVEVYIWEAPSGEIRYQLITKDEAWRKTSY